MINEASMIRPSSTLMLWQTPIEFAHRIMGGSPDESNIHGHSGKVSIRYKFQHSLPEKHFTNFQYKIERTFEEQIRNTLNYSLILNINDPLISSLMDKGFASATSWELIKATIRRDMNETGFYSTANTVPNYFSQGLKINVVESQPDANCLARSIFNAVQPIAASNQGEVVSVEFVESSLRRGQFTPERIESLVVSTAEEDSNSTDNSGINTPEDQE